jgi:hypothetical protein
MIDLDKLKAQYIQPWQPGCDEFNSTYELIQQLIAELEQLRGVIELQTHTIAGLQAHNEVDAQKREVDQARIKELEKQFDTLRKTSQTVYDRLWADAMVDDTLYLTDMEAYNAWQEVLTEQLPNETGN